MNIKDLNNSLMYKDRVNVYRHIKIKNPDNSTTQKLDLIPDLENIPCMLSIKTPDNPEQTEDINSLKVIYTLFTDSSHGFKKGDFLEVIRHGETHKLQSGKPIIYAFQQEIPCIEKGWV